MEKFESVVCRFCGQVLQLSPNWLRDGETMEEYADRVCNCPEAKAERDRREHERTRAEKLARAQEHVDDIFSEQDEKIKRILDDGCALIYDGVIQKITLVIDEETSAVIKQGATAALQIERKDKTSTGASI